MGGIADERTGMHPVRAPGARRALADPKLLTPLCRPPDAPFMATGSEGRMTPQLNRNGTGHRPGRRGALGLGHVALILGVVALVLGGSGLAIALSNAGHTGTQGPRGAAGPGAITSSNFDLALTNVPDLTCTHDNDSNLSFVVAEPGDVVLSATVVLDIQHTAGQSTTYYVAVENQSGGCAVNFDTYGQITTTSPTGEYFPDVSMEVEYALGAAGTYTYAIDAEAINTSASDTTTIFEASEVGTFYPT